MPSPTLGLIEIVAAKIKCARCEAPLIPKSTINTDSNTATIHCTDCSAPIITFPLELVDAKQALEGLLKRPTIMVTIEREPSKPFTAGGVSK